MKRDDFFIETEVDSGLGIPFTEKSANEGLFKALASGPISDYQDLDVALALAHFVHEELEAYGTHGNTALDNDQSRLAILALRTTLHRLGISLELPFRDFQSFHKHWLANNAYGSWQARREILGAIFEPLHNELYAREDTALQSRLEQNASGQFRTSWPRVDEELAELRRHFTAAQSAQDYRNIGNDAVAILERLSEVVYVPERHLRPGETEPLVTQTKQRLTRVVETDLPGSSNAEMRKLVRSAIDFAQAIKHSPAPDRQSAGMIADTVILVSSLFRRINNPEH